MSEIKLYFKYIQIVIRSQMEYKISFLLMSIGHFIITFIEFVGLHALFQRFNNIKVGQSMKLLIHLLMAV